MISKEVQRVEAALAALLTGFPIRRTKKVLEVVQTAMRGGSIHDFAAAYGVR